MENGLSKVSWNQDEEAALRHIIKLGQLLARLRGVVPAWEIQELSNYGNGLGSYDKL